jgi:hypothetical protein
MSCDITLERMTGIEPALSAWEANEPTSQGVFQAQARPFEGPFWWLIRRVGVRGGPEQLIKMATGQRGRRLRQEAAAAAASCPIMLLSARP